MTCCASMSYIKIVKRSVFIQSLYGEFNGVIFLRSTNECSSTIIFSVLISVFPWFSIKVIVTWWFFVPAWVILKLSKGVFSYNFGMEHLMVQSVFNVRYSMFINFHLFSIDQCVFLIFHESHSYLIIISSIMSDIEIMKRRVFTQLWYKDFNGAMCF